MNIGIDVMGGDYAPQATIAGAILAQKELNGSDRIVLIGNETIIHEQLEAHDADVSLFDIVHAPDVIEMGESPTRAFTKKPASSMAASSPAAAPPFILARICKASLGCR